jgi:hypothetical protein
MANAAASTRSRLNSSLAASKQKIPSAFVAVD